MADMNSKYRPVILSGFAVALVLIVSQLYLQYNLFALNEEASLINFAGKQRMFTQEMAVHISEERPEAYISVMNKLETDHKNIAGKAREMGLPVEVQELADEIASTFSHVTKYAHTIPENTNIYGQLFSLMEEQEMLVMAIQQHHDKSIASMQWVRWVAFGFALIVLFYHFFFMIRPSLTSLNDSRLEEIQNQANIDMNIRMSRLLAHDMKSPIQSLQLSASILRYKYPELDQKCIDALESELDHVENVINNILPKKSNTSKLTPES